MYAQYMLVKRLLCFWNVCDCRFEVRVIAGHRGVTKSLVPASSRENFVNKLHVLLVPRICGSPAIWFEIAGDSCNSCVPGFRPRNTLQWSSPNKSPKVLWIIAANYMYQLYPTTQLALNAKLSQNHQSPDGGCLRISLETLSKAYTCFCTHIDHFSTIHHIPR